MTDKGTGKYQKRIITIPNILSFIRLLLIPVIIWLYCFKKNYFAAILVLLLSGATDVLDGIIARNFDMVSDFGKAFDPIADKLTQISILACLVTRYVHLLLPLIVLTVKEVIAGIFNLITISNTGEVFSAEWHGKLTTILIYSVIMIHLIWFNIPPLVSDILIGVTTPVMLFSAVLYTLRSICALKQNKESGNV